MEKLHRVLYTGRLKSTPGLFLEHSSICYPSCFACISFPPVHCEMATPSNRCFPSIFLFPTLCAKPSFLHVPPSYLLHFYYTGSLHTDPRFAFSVDIIRTCRFTSVRHLLIVYTVFFFLPNRHLYI